MHVIVRTRSGKEHQHKCNAAADDMTTEQACKDYFKRFPPEANGVIWIVDTIYMVREIESIAFVEGEVQVQL